MSDSKNKMIAVVITGNGGYDKLDYRAVPMPVAGPNEVVLRVLAAGVNNTDINTRLGWYSSSVTADTDAASETQEAKADEKADGGWNGATPFPMSVFNLKYCCSCKMPHYYLRPHNRTPATSTPAHIT